MIPHLDWIAGASTLISTQLIAMKYWQGWVLKLCNCLLWVYLMYHAGYYALVTLEVVHLAQGSWALWSWTRKVNA